MKEERGERDRKRDWKRDSVRVKEITGNIDRYRMRNR
jgi:hypothetical protein